MFVFECAKVIDGEQVVGVFGAFGGTVDHDRGGDEVVGRHLRDVFVVAAADPMYGRVEVRARVLADLEPVPRPRGPALVVVADLVPLQLRCLRELVGKLNHRGALVQRLGQVNDLDGAASERLDERCDRVLRYHLILLSVGAERLSEPLCPYFRVDLGVDYERPIPYVQPAPNRRNVILAPDGDAFGPGRSRERGEVGLREACQLYRPSHGAEVVDLRAVGRVVVHDDEHRQPVTGGRLQLPQGHEGSAVPHGGDGEPLRPRDRGPYAARESQPHRLESVGEHEPLLVRYLQIHRRVTEKMARVGADRAFLREQVVQGDGQGARVYVFVGTEILVRLVAGATLGDLAFQPLCSEAFVAHTPPVELVYDGPGRSCRVPDHAGVGVVHTPDRLRFEIHLHHARFGREQAAMAHGPVVE